jgi:hypothetical protein
MGAFHVDLPVDETAGIGGIGTGSGAISRVGRINPPSIRREKIESRRGNRLTGWNK